MFRLFLSLSHISPQTQPAVSLTSSKMEGVSLGGPDMGGHGRRHALHGHEGRPHYLLTGPHAVLWLREGRVDDRNGCECEAKEAIHFWVSGIVYKK